MSVDGPTPAPESDWLGTKFLRFERHGSMAHCVVDRPEARNAMTPPMYFGVRRAVDIVDRDRDLAGLLIAGVDDVFVPGGDLAGGDEEAWADIGDLLGMDITPFDAIRHSGKPVVSAVNGICQGGGLMMAMLSDVAVASERATFRAPEALRGIADTHYAQILPHQIGPARARDLLLTGRTIDAGTALDWGVVTRVVPHDELPSLATEALLECCYAAPGARRTLKRVINDQYGAYDRLSMDESLASDECREGMTAFAERRSPRWIPEDIRPEGRL
ncbi:MAG: enoyl-CoA hydratase/isomerase family protein [Acidimicrobiia bacterium]|nr:enoyl-CoA hydratase/isomerase family protein [Acidimicrobiia bacterium]